MSSTATAFDVESSPCERMDAFFAEIGELTGQRNAIDARLVQIAAEIDRDGLGCHRCPVDGVDDGVENRCVAA